MEIVFEHVPADRGLPDAVRGRHGKLVPMVVKHRNAGSDDSARSRSRRPSPTACAKTACSILTSDAMVDSRFGAGDSIRFHGIRSAMCAPLWNKDQVIGIIHVDSPDARELLQTERPRPADRTRELRRGGGGAGARSTRRSWPRRRRGSGWAGSSPRRSPAASSQPPTPRAALGRAGGEGRLVLFADIVGFTTMSEKMSPARWLCS
jgi:adenylate cyclase